MAKKLLLKLYKENKNELGFTVEADEVIERFSKSNFAKDKTRELKVRMILFIASKDGYQSSIGNYEDFNTLMNRYNSLNRN